MQKSLRKNFFYNMTWTIISFLTPLITTPYISRVLGVSNIGIYSYTASIVSYFTLISGFGFSGWGLREVAYAQSKDDKQLQTALFYEVIMTRGTITAMVLVSYLLFVSWQDAYIPVYLLQALSLFNNMIDIAWFYQGIEEFRKIAVRNIIMKILTVAATFLFVKTKDDLYLYTAIQMISLVAGNLVMWFGISKYLCRIPRSSIRFFRHIKEVFGFFILQLVVQMNLNIDKTILGILTKMPEENGYYEQAGKIIILCKQIFMSLITVLVPRMANYFASSNKKDFLQLIKKASRWMILLSCAITVGLFVIAHDFVLLFLGEEYEKAGTVLKIYSLILLLTPLGTFLGYLLVQTGRQKLNTIAIFWGAVFNILLNLMLIKTYLSVGATIATILSEFLILILHLWYTRDVIEIRDILQSYCKYMLCAAVMGGGVAATRFALSGTEISLLGLLVIEIIVGVCTYFGILIIILKDKTLITEAKNYIKKKNERIGL